jgi:hypothetical protein
VGEGSLIANVRGIRSDVVAALRALHVPNVRWPGGSAVTPRPVAGHHDAGVVMLDLPAKSVTVVRLSQ